MSVITKAFNGNTIQNYEVKTAEESLNDSLILTDGDASYLRFSVVRDEVPISIELYGTFSGSFNTGQSFIEVVAEHNTSSLVSGYAATVYDSILIETYDFSEPVTLRELAFFDHSEIGLAHFYRDDDYFYDSGRNDDAVFGYGGNDHFFSTKFGDYEDKFFGGDGTDHLHLTMHKNYYSIEQINYVYDPRTNLANKEGYFIRDAVVDGVDNGQVMINSVERVHFDDISVAFDIDGNAGKTAKILGAVFGAEAVSNEVYAGIGLDYLDKGTSYEDLMTLAINVAVGADASNATIVEHLYQNVVGVTPSTSEAQFYIDLLEDGAYTKGSLGVLAAETSLNLANINLTGLAETGLDYLPIA